MRQHAHTSLPTIATVACQSCEGPGIAHDDAVELSSLSRLVRRQIVTAGGCEGGTPLCICLTVEYMARDSCAVPVIVSGRM